MINFIKYTRLYFAISALILIPGVYSLATYGLSPSIDFTGGAQYEVRFLQEVSQDPGQIVTEALKNAEKPALEDVTFTSAQGTDSGSFILRFSPISDQQRKEVRNILEESLGELEEVRFETVGPTIGRELLIKTLVAVGIASVSIVGFIAWSFKDVTYGLAAVLAMFHDTLILLGTFSLFGKFFGVEVDALFVAAVLTILSFSVHDTIVVFDRIREALRLNRGSDFTYIANKSISETLVRSLNNSLTIIFMLLALIVLGGDTIRWFVAALLVGTIAGTYSSTFTAVPILHILVTRRK